MSGALPLSGCCLAYLGIADTVAILVRTAVRRVRGPEVWRLASVIMDTCAGASGRLISNGPRALREECVRLRLQTCYETINTVDFKQINSTYRPQL